MAATTRSAPSARTAAASRKALSAPPLYATSTEPRVAQVGLQRRQPGGQQVLVEPGRELGEVVEHDVGARREELLAGAAAGQHGDADRARRERTLDVVDVVADVDRCTPSRRSPRPCRHPRPTPRGGRRRTPGGRGAAARCGVLAGHDDGGRRGVRTAARASCAPAEAAPSRSRGRGRSPGTGRPAGADRLGARGTARASSPAAARAWRSSPRPGTRRRAPPPAPPARARSPAPCRSASCRGRSPRRAGRRGTGMRKRRWLRASAPRTQSRTRSVWSPRDPPDVRCAHRLASREEGHQEEEGQSGRALRETVLLLTFAILLALRRQDLLHPVLLHPVGVDGAGRWSSTTGSWCRSRRTGTASRSAATSSSSTTRATGSTGCRTRSRRTCSPGALSKIGLYPTGGHLVKRVIGVEGDVIVCCDEQGRLTVNGIADRRERLPAEQRGQASPATDR